MASRSLTRAAIVHRLRRDYPDILARYERGEFRFARQAGLAAGILKPRDAPGSGRDRPPVPELDEDLVEELAERDQAEKAELIAANEKFTELLAREWTGSGGRREAT